MFFYAALEKDKHFLLDSPGIAWSPAGIAPFFGLSGVIRLPGPVRFLFPARRPRGFLDRGFRFRFPDRSLWHRFLIRLCRTEIPARRPRGLLDRGFRFRFPDRSLWHRFLIRLCRRRSPAWNHAVFWPERCYSAARPCPVPLPCPVPVRLPCPGLPAPFPCLEPPAPFCSQAL